jgi:hypothetical protein
MGSAVLLARGATVQSKPNEHGIHTTGPARMSRKAHDGAIHPGPGADLTLDAGHVEVGCWTDGDPQASRSVVGKAPPPGPIGRQPLAVSPPVFR